MGHPLKSFENFRILIKLPTGEFLRNPDTGNREEYFETQSYRLTAKTGSNNNSDRVYQDNINKTYLECRFIEPKIIPSSLRVGDVLEAYMKDVFTGEELKGEFVIESIIQSRVRVVSKILGSCLKGWFIET